MLRDQLDQDGTPLSRSCRMSISIFACSLAGAISSAVPRWGEHCWRLTWCDFAGLQSGDRRFFSCLLLIIEISALKCHVLDGCTKRIGKGVVQAGA